MLVIIVNGMTRLSEFLMRLKSFDGTATELAALLEEHTGEKLLPSVLSKRLVRYAADLDKTGIHITSSRTRDSRQLHILCIDGDGNDGNDGKNETGSVSNFLSQPSQLSPET